MNAIQKFIEAEHKYLDLNEIDYKEYEQMVEPLRDVEAVVRCKDCRFSILIPPCNQRKCDGAMEKIVSDDFFCADGERKDGDGK